MVGTSDVWGVTGRHQYHLHLFPHFPLNCVAMADSPPPAAGAHDPVGAKKLNALIGKRGAPDEVLAPAREEEYITYRKLTDFREPYR